MANDIKITLIATGFVSKTDFSQDEEEDELTKQLKGIKTEDELDVPSFLRRPLFSRQRQAITPPDKVSKEVSHNW
jgi:cell division protein FtsZ